ncbi:MAG: argininosuccinate lyase [Ruminococcaceae bacterium]|nr:argininosuccinate lyase [Oscillospiraceae bacterium]
MEKLWTGRFQKPLNEIADAFNASITFDSRMCLQDITGSIAHASMLAKQGIISESEKESIVETLGAIAADLQSGALEIDTSCEDIHMFIEGELTARIGDVGKKLHTARSRNDQVALDLRLYLREECAEIVELIGAVITAVVGVAEKNVDTIVPGYTHLQRAQPISFAHHLLAYCAMFERDKGRIQDALQRMDSSPIGSCALAGTTYATDREYEAQLLGFSTPCRNSIDGVSDRDFCLELMSAFSITMMHLSRFCEEIILWSSWEFRFVELDDSFTTGSSIMPQKKNADMAELIRGKTGRVYGNLFGLFTTLKGLPLAYNKDMQEDKEGIFDSIDTLKMSLQVFAPMVASMHVKKENMLAAAKGGFINATDLADYLTKKGMPFRTAYKLTGQIVAYCIENGLDLESVDLARYQEFSPLFEADLYEEISLQACVNKRISQGGTGQESVQSQIAYYKKM